MYPSSMRAPWANRGYTLVELLVVMVVLAVLAAATFPLAEVKLQRDREQELKRALWVIRDAIDAYKRAADAGAIHRAEGTSGYPAELADLVKGVPSASNARDTLYFLRRIPRDPFSEPGLPAERSWGLRSFQSPPDRPRAGNDVYDVYSRSTRVGLNGIALEDW